MVRFLALIAATLALAAAGCGGDDGDDSAGEATETAAASSCERGDLELVIPGQLTIATDNPAFPPWFEVAGRRARSGS